MKKILFFALLANFSFIGFAQDSEEETNTTKAKPSTFQGVKYGIRGGLTNSNLNFDGTPTVENKHRNSIYIGAFAEIGLSKIFAIAPELQFSAEGANEEVLHLDYIQVPILFKFNLNSRLSLGAGPQVGLKVHKEDDNMVNFAYSGVAGIEYKLNYAMFIDARYTYGFRNIFDDNVGVSATNTNFQLGIGYKF